MNNTQGKSQGKHTALPWTVIEEAEANAQFIVKAVNCHDELVEACKEALLELGKVVASAKIKSMDGNYYIPHTKAMTLLTEAIRHAEEGK